MQKLIFFKVGYYTFGAQFKHLQTILKLNSSSPSFTMENGIKRLRFKNINAHVRCIKEMLQLKSPVDAPLEDNIIVLRWQKYSYAFPVDFIVGVVEVKNIYTMPPFFKTFIRSGLSHIIFSGKRIIPVIKPDDLEQTVPLPQKTETQTISSAKGDETFNLTFHNSSNIPVTFASNKMKRKGQVILFPARTPLKKGKRIYFLFSVTQVEDILRPLKVHEMPLCPPHVDGITHWRDEALPVISLERYLDLDMNTETNSHRSLIIRYPMATMSGIKVIRGALNVSPFIEKLSVPSNHPVKSQDFFSDPKLLKGTFQWENNILCVIDLGILLSGIGKV